MEHNEHFWKEVWQFCDLIGTQGDIVKAQGESRWQSPMQNRDAVWFPHAKVNYAENLFSLAERQADELAIWFENERGYKQTYTWKQLCDEPRAFSNG